MLYIAIVNIASYFLVGESRFFHRLAKGICDFRADFRSTIKSLNLRIARSVYVNARVIRTNVL